MSSPEDTSRRDPLLHLAGSLGGSDRYIEEMEAAGQRELVNSDVLPTDSPWEELQALGFTRGEIVPGDALFTRCTLPEGWHRGGTDHDMWSSVLDERSVVRVDVFYKAAFYDRHAFARTTRPGWQLASGALYSEGAPALPKPWDVLTEEEREQFRDAVEDTRQECERQPHIYGEARLRRAEALLELAGPASVGEPPC